MRIPISDPKDFRSKKKTPSLDDKTRLEIVYEALITATENTVYGPIELKPNSHNQLSKLFRFETLMILEWDILKRGPSVFRIEASNYGNKLVPKNEQEDTINFRPREPLYRPTPLPENVPIKLYLFDSFANWRSSYLQKKSISFESLSEGGREKIYKTVLAINKEFELTSNPKVTVYWIPGDETQNWSARSHSLDFLKNKDIVENVTPWTSPTGGGGYHHVEINIKEFKKFQEEIFGFFATNTKSEKPIETPAPATNEKDEPKPFKQEKWERISIQFIDGHNVKISAKDKVIKANYKEMGFENTKSLRPNVQWELLQNIAKSQGALSWDGDKADQKNKKRKQLLSDALCAYFAIQDDPFYAYKHEKAYRMKATLLPE